MIPIIFRGFNPILLPGAKARERMWDKFSHAINGVAIEENHQLKTINGAAIEGAEYLHLFLFHQDL
jgi:hypothetical protein